MLAAKEGRVGRTLVEVGWDELRAKRVKNGVECISVFRTGGVPALVEARVSWGWRRRVVNTLRPEPASRGMCASLQCSLLRSLRATRGELGYCVVRVEAHLELLEDGFADPADLCVESEDVDGGLSRRVGESARAGAELFAVLECLL